jgi:hypothetical protein
LDSCVLWNDIRARFPGALSPDVRGPVLTVSDLGRPQVLYSLEFNRTGAQVVDSLAAINGNGDGAFSALEAVLRENVCLSAAPFLRTGGTVRIDLSGAVEQDSPEFRIDRETLLSFEIFDIDDCEVH